MLWVILLNSKLCCILLWVHLSWLLLQLLLTPMGCCKFQLLSPCLQIWQLILRLSEGNLEWSDSRLTGGCKGMSSIMSIYYLPHFLLWAFSHPCLVSTPTTGWTLGSYEILALCAVMFRFVDINTAWVKADHGRDFHPVDKHSRFNPRKVHQLSIRCSM